MRTYGCVGGARMTSVESTKEHLYGIKGLVAAWAKKQQSSVCHWEVAS